MIFEDEIVAFSKLDHERRVSITVTLNAPFAVVLNALRVFFDQVE